MDTAEPWPHCPWIGRSEMDVGVIGLGIMGEAMATNLLGSGHRVTGYDIDTNKAGPLADLGLAVAGNPQEVANQAHVVIFSLPTSDALHDVSSAVAETAKSGLVCVETGT